MTLSLKACLEGLSEAEVSVEDEDGAETGEDSISSTPSLR